MSSFKMIDKEDMFNNCLRSFKNKRPKEIIRTSMSIEINMWIISDYYLELIEG